MVQRLDRVHHIAVQVADLASSIAWYRENFEVELAYSDSTWALLAFQNTSLALVLAHEHPGHFAIERPDDGTYGLLTEHRDGTRSKYILDPSGNTIELLVDTQECLGETVCLEDKTA